MQGVALSHNAKEMLRCVSNGIAEKRAAKELHSAE